MFGDFMNGSPYLIKQGAEVIVAHWGKGFESPIHGHDSGYHYEQLLFGSFMLYSYRMTNEQHRIARPVSMKIVTDASEPFISIYEKNNGTLRANMIHHFKALEQSASLHFLTEHSRDGYGNTFKIEYFDDFYNINVSNSTRLTLEQANNLKVGDVALVRSKDGTNYGDHFIIITGDLKKEQHGTRLDHICIPARGNNAIFDLYENQEFLVLKLNKDLTSKFLEFHDINTGAIMKEQKEETIFDDVFDLRYEDVERISTQEGMYLHTGDVVLVRSSSIPEAGDHYILVTGHPVQKEHGMRPQTISFPAIQESPLLDLFDKPSEKVILLKLREKAKKAFHEFNNIKMEKNKLILDKLILTSNLIVS